MGLVKTPGRLRASGNTRPATTPGGRGETFSMSSATNVCYSPPRSFGYSKKKIYHFRARIYFCRAARTFEGRTLFIEILLRRFSYWGPPSGSRISRALRPGRSDYTRESSLVCPFNPVKDYILISYGRFDLSVEGSMPRTHIDRFKSTIMQTWMRTMMMMMMIMVNHRFGRQWCFHMPTKQQ